MPPNKNQLQQMCLSVFYNAISFALTGSSQYAEKAAYFLDIFFKDARYRMNPNADYAQLIRGPHPSGSFMGVLDLRSLVQVANAVNILRYTKSPAWDGDRDSAIVSWAKDYIQWLGINTYARTARTKDKCVILLRCYGPCSLALFPVTTSPSSMLNSQHSRCSSRMRRELANLWGCSSMVNFRNKSCKMASRYESIRNLACVLTLVQVFEADRTRPFHYRCFNLEAMIVSSCDSEEPVAYFECRHVQSLPTPWGSTTGRRRQSTVHGSKRLSIT